MTTKAEVHVGIDVSKDRLDLAVLEGKRIEQYSNKAGGIKELVKEMMKLEPEIIVVEVTGGYERAIVYALYEAGLPVARVSGYRARQYAHAKGRLAKTDELDALNLADYGKHVQLRLFEAKSEQGQWLSGKLARRRQLGEMVKAEKNRLRLVYGDNGPSIERPSVHSVLYMAVLTGIRYIPVIKKQYDGLVARGKVKKVALTARMRKLLTILNAMMRDQQPFRYSATA